MQRPAASKKCCADPDGELGELDVYETHLIPLVLFAVMGRELSVEISAMITRPGRLHLRLRRRQRRRGKERREPSG
jgi:hypothetical protein